VPSSNYNERDEESGAALWSRSSLRSAPACLMLYLGFGRVACLIGSVASDGGDQSGGAGLLGVSGSWVCGGVIMGGCVELAGFLTM